MKQNSAIEFKIANPDRISKLHQSCRYINKQMCMQNMYKKER